MGQGGPPSPERARYASLPHTLPHQHSSGTGFISSLQPSRPYAQKKEPHPEEISSLTIFVEYTKLLHGFAKKTQKLPRKELEIASRRLAHFVER